MSEQEQQSVEKSDAQIKMDELQASIQQFNNDLEHIKAARVEVEQIKTALSEARGSADADITAMSESKETFQNLKKQAQAQSTQLKSKSDDLNAQIEETSNQKSQLDNSLTEIKTIKDEAEQARASVNVDIENINQTKVSFEQLRNDAQALHTDLQSRQTDAQNKINEIHDLHAKTKELFNELLEDTRDENGEITGECIKTKIQNLFSEIENQLQQTGEDREESKTQLENLRQELENEIRSLLPEAGAAGLSSAYVQAKSKYGSIPFESTSSGFMRFLKYCGHITKTNASSIVYYTMFIVPLAVMIYLLFGLFHDIKSADIDEKVILFRALITLPLAAISLFGWSSIRLSRRLYEEYNHKQRVMQLYHSFKDEIDGHGTDEHKQALLSIMLKAVDDKPSLAMHKYDKGIEDIWPSLSLGSLLPFLGTKKDET